MSKKRMIYIFSIIAVVLIIAFVIYFIVTSNKSGSSKSNSKITITKYNENFEVEKEIEITDKKQIKEISKICENPSLEQDDTSPYLAIRNDVKVDLENGKFFMIQLTLTEYCYYEDANSNTKLVIKMPSGLLELVNNILSNAPESVPNNMSKIVINTYESFNLNPTRSITIDNKEENSEITALISKISEPALVDLLLKKDIEIVIDDKIYITLQKDEPKYCYYKNTDSEEEYLAKAPEGLLEKVNNILQ